MLSELDTSLLKSVLVTVGIVLNSVEYGYELRLGCIHNHLFVIACLVFVPMHLLEENLQDGWRVEVIFSLLIAVVDGDVFNLCVGVLGFYSDRKGKQA